MNHGVAGLLESTFCVPYSVPRSSSDPPSFLTNQISRVAFQEKRVLKDALTPWNIKFQHVIRGDRLALFRVPYTSLRKVITVRSIGSYSESHFMQIKCDIII
jgi:hypothetical protein